MGREYGVSHLALAGWAWILEFHQNGIMGVARSNQSGKRARAAGNWAARSKRKIVRGLEKPGPVSPRFISADHTEHSRHILLVEDHEPTRLALARWLRNRHYKVTSAASFSEARALIKTQHFQLLISDIGLPDGSGHKLMVEFKKKFGASGIALTGYGLEEDIAQSRAAGFTAHLTKPVRVEFLDNALELASHVATDAVFVKNGMPRSD